MFQRILVMTDFSAAATRALETVRENFPRAEIRLVHVLERSGLSAGLATPAGGIGAPALALAESDQDWERDARERLAALGGGEIVRGAPADVALETARAWPADLIALGTDSRGFERFVFGSVASRVARDSPVPVLTVRAAG